MKACANPVKRRGFAFLINPMAHSANVCGCTIRNLIALVVQIIVFIVRFPSLFPRSGMFIHRCALCSAMDHCSCTRQGGAVGSG
jgi:hypothetical protein